MGFLKKTRSIKHLEHLETFRKLTGKFWKPWNDKYLRDEEKSQEENIMPLFLSLLTRVPASYLWDVGGQDAESLVSKSEKDVKTWRCSHITNVCSYDLLLLHHEVSDLYEASDSFQAFVNLIFWYSVSYWRP